MPYAPSLCHSRRTCTRLYAYASRALAGANGRRPTQQQQPAGDVRITGNLNRLAVSGPSEVAPPSKMASTSSAAESSRSGSVTESIEVEEVPGMGRDDSIEIRDDSTCVVS